MAHQLLPAVCICIIIGISDIVVSAQLSLQDLQIAFADKVVLGDLYKYRPNENQCSSALGISVMMSLLYPAMSEEARAQAQAVFGYPSIDNGAVLVWANVTSDINSRYDGSCLHPDECSIGNNPLVSITNSVWIQQDFVPDANYATILAGLQYPIDFSRHTAETEVNAWVNQTTNGVIDSIYGK
jgi:serine protease inhibitor